MGENYQKHLNGGKHLKNMQRIKEISFRRKIGDGSLRTGMENDEKPSQYAERIKQFHMTRADSPVYGDGSPSPKRSKSPEYRASPPSRKGSARSPKRSKRPRRRSPYSSSSSSSSSSPSPPRSPPRRSSHRRSRSRSPLQMQHRRKADRRSRTRSPPPFAQQAPVSGSAFEIPKYVRKEHGVFKCEVCNKEAKTMEVLQAHLTSKDHKKRTAPVQEFRCEPCNLVVSSEETLRQHFAGMPHMRVIQVQEQNRKRIDEYSRNSYDPSAFSINDELVVLRQKCQEQDKQIRNLKSQNQNLIKKIEYYEKNARIKSEKNSIADE